MGFGVELSAVYVELLWGWESSVHKPGDVCLLVWVVECFEGVGQGLCVQEFDIYVVGFEVVE